jgi:hypothetical protein
MHGSPYNFTVQCLINIEIILFTLQEYSHIFYFFDAMSMIGAVMSCVIFRL